MLMLFVRTAWIMFLSASSLDGSDVSSHSSEEERIKPQVFIAGVTKAGSSSLYEWLCKHPHFLPIEATHILPKHVRLRVLRTWMERTGKNEKEQKFIELNFRMANVSREEVMSPDVRVIEEIRGPDFFRITDPILMGKETRFFKKEYMEHWRTLADHYGDDELPSKWFLDIFPRKPVNAEDGVNYMTGDASPQYIETPFKSAQAIYQMFPSAKIIMIVREPLSKFRSLVGVILGGEWFCLDEMTAGMRQNLRAGVNCFLSAFRHLWQK
eukprot:gnl/MRDRNA2_/MRDRNA2_76669_c0_seq2.p1 gnl/MRDRNA2_/MRDRNA2_76669_c0~~gnl/MRDRNA2_/MRDRNA2_76669_c0_seq2.p1  ORF type:complete len:268 (-),score=28.95 gnl/MRDRNA2_/MRDRNA2_76669_c0_seq2:425-1228(-)